jgi:hypothetical protein
MILQKMSVTICEKLPEVTLGQRDFFAVNVLFFAKPSGV